MVSAAVGIRPAPSPPIVCAGDGGGPASGGPASGVSTGPASAGPASATGGKCTGFSKFAPLVQARTASAAASGQTARIGPPRTRRRFARPVAEATLRALPCPAGPFGGGHSAQTFPRQGG